MATYVNDLRLKEIGTGESSGTWGTETNVNLELIGEALGFGTEAITTNADTHTTTVADGSTDPGRAMYIKYTGTLDSACTITIGPNTINRLHYIENATSGSQNIIISQGSGANITIPAGDTKAVYLDGAGSGAAVVDVFASFSTVDLKVQDDLTVTDDATIGGTLGVTGILTCTDDIIIGDGKTIGSASDVDAMTIASNGQVTFTQTLIGTALDISGDIDVDGTSNLDVVDIDGAVDMASTLTVAGVVDITDSTDSSDATGDTGALRTEGGASIAKKLYVGTDLDVDGTANLDVVDVDGLLTASAAIEINGAAGAAISEGLLIDWSTNLARFLTYDSSSGSEIAFFTQPNGGSSTERVRIKEDGGFVVTPAAGGHAVFNEGSVDADFRVETNGLTNGFVIDGGNNGIGFGVTPRSDLHTTWTQIFFGQKGSIISERLGSGGLYGTLLTDNVYIDSDTGTYAAIEANESSKYTQEAGSHIFHSAASASAGAAPTFVEALRLSASDVVINEASADINLRVESNGNANMLFVDGGQNRVGMATGAPQHTLDVYGEDDVTLRLHRPNSGLAATDTCGIAFSQRGDDTTSTSDSRAGIFSTYNGNIFLATESGGNITSNPGDHSRLYVAGLGNVGVGQGNVSPADPLHVAGNMRVSTTVADSTELRFKVTPGGAGDNCTVALYQDDASTAGVFLQADGASWFTGGINPGSGDTTASNVLDDYEEGTWTPVLTRVSAPNITFNVEEANYTKIGRMVTVQMGLLITGVTSQGSSVTFVDGLPFNNGGVAYSSTGSVGMNNGFASECHVCQIGGNADNTINFHADDISFANLQTDFTNGGRIYCSLTYEAS